MLYYPLVNDHFWIEDWDFSDVYWNHWTKLSSNDERAWINIVDKILKQKEPYWTHAKSARIYQLSKKGYKHSITSETVLSSWVLRLRELPCLPDTRGFPRKPRDLLRRTPETELLLDIEPFVHGLLDRETTRPLLALLGVQDTPAGPDRLLERLRSLSRAETPPVPEVERLYHRLDQMAATCSTEAFQKIKQAFRSERLVFTQDDAWSAADSVFLFSDEDDAPQSWKSAGCRSCAAPWSRPATSASV